MKIIFSVVAVCAAVGAGAWAFMQKKQDVSNEKKETTTDMERSSEDKKPENPKTENRIEYKSPEISSCQTVSQVFEEQSDAQSSTRKPTGDSDSDESETRRQEAGAASWLRIHRKQILIGGVCVFVAATAIYLNRELLLDFFLNRKSETIQAMVDTVGKGTPDGIVIDTISNAVEDAVPGGAEKIVSVSSHLRKLPPGWTASAEKIAEAARLGIELPDGMTLVDDYTKTIAA